MINYAESIDPAISKESEQQTNYVIKKIYPLAPGNVPIKKARSKLYPKKRIPLCNWTMPTQPEGYIRAGKYDFL